MVGYGMRVPPNTMGEPGPRAPAPPAALLAAAGSSSGGPGRAGPPGSTMNQRFVTDGLFAYSAAAMPPERVVQNQSGGRGVNWGTGGTGIMAGDNPIVPPGQEHCSIAGELQDDCCGWRGACGDQKFVMEFQPGKLSLTQHEFEECLAEFNSAIKKPSWYPYPCCIVFHASTCHCLDEQRKGVCCATFKLETVAKNMTAKWAHKNLEFVICDRQEVLLDVGVPCHDDCCGDNLMDVYYLVIKQN